MARPMLLGIEIGGTKLQVALGHGDGTILQLRRTAVVPANGAARIRAQIVEEADQACWSLGLTREAIQAVGIGFGGPIDAEKGIVTASHHVDGWDGFRLADWCRTEFNVEASAITIENDADTAGLGEARFGAGKGKDPLLYVTIGSGVGGGLILGGQIHRGCGQGASEVGHLWVSPPDEKGNGGKTVEQFASGWSIGRAGSQAVEEHHTGSKILSDLVDGEPNDVTAEVVAMAAGLGDDVSKQILSEATKALAAGLAHAVTLIAPERIILGGGVSMIGDEFWFEPIRRRLNQLVFPPFRGTFDVVPAAMGEEVVLQGALALAKDGWKSSQSAEG